VRPAAVLLVLGLLVAGCTSGSADPAPTTTTGQVTAPSPSAAPSTEPPTTTAAPADERTELQRVVDGAVAGRPVPFSVVVEDLTTGVRADHDAGREVWSASLYKLFVAREVLRRFGAGELRRDAQAGDGRGRTWEQCLHDMIVVSDDPCGVAGLRLVGHGALDARLAADGYRSTHLDNPQRTSAQDVTRFLLATRDRTLLGPGGEELTAELWDLLRAQQVDDRLPVGLPPGTPIAHKTGDRTGWAHDAGVVTAPRGDYLVVVLTGPWAAPCCHEETLGPADRAAFGAIADVSARVWGYLGRR
jgi:beta-lactamase class A